ncbi:MAG: RNA-binding protein [Armatimonadetes bacterium]|jgi:hypothetical protein|nr:MAG: RNA-binding protein [Armatimonadota bacterium]GIV03525.1 MAG: hypothetical protein KatS3mg015_2355 [Fimbriimonadales bacterium]
MYALNFYSDIYLDVLKNHRKTVTIRLGDKTDKYRTGEIVWVTVGQRFGRRQKLFAAIIDRVDVKPIRELSPREIQRENPSFHTAEEVVTLLCRIYGQPITLDSLVSVIHFSPIDE